MNQCMERTTANINMVDSFTPLQQVCRSSYLPSSVSLPNLSSESGTQPVSDTRDQFELNGMLSVNEPTNRTTSESCNDHGVRTHWLTKVQLRKTLFIVWLIFITVVVVVLLAIPDYPGGKNIKFNLELVPVAAGILTMLIDAALNGKNARFAISDIDWSLIALFMGLFVWLRGLKRWVFPVNY